MTWNQPEINIQFAWGPAGLAHRTPHSDVIIIVDVLSFSTCVDMAVSRDCAVYPSTEWGQPAAAYAQSLGALLIAMKPQDHPFTFSPTSLLGLPRGTPIVLPSPNGSTLSLATSDLPTLTGCLRNARAVAQAAQQLGGRVSVIAAGEKWPDGSLRPALEDLLGAGAILSRLEGNLSGDAQAAVAAFEDSRASLSARIHTCPSGQELIEKGRSADVALACELDQSGTRPFLKDGAYVDQASRDRFV
jgi:2-phosphosulfolactate phosphatase